MEGAEERLSRECECVELRMCWRREGEGTSSSRPAAIREISFPFSRQPPMNGNWPLDHLLRKIGFT